MPDFSFAQTIQIACPECSAPLMAEAWLIVDTAARPDLLMALREGRLHTLTCANDHPIGLDLPVLLYRPAADPVLLFSPAEQTSQEEDQEHADALLGALRDAVGVGWNPVWIEQMPVVPRRLLPPLLVDDPAAALAQMQAEIAAELERLRREDPQQFAQLEQAARDALAETETLPPLLALLQQFIDADTWNESQRIVQQNPDLLTDEMDALLTQLCDVAQAQGDENATRQFTTHRDLLRRCRQIGVEAAFAEKMGRSDVPPEMQFFLEALQSLPEAQRQALRDLFQQADSPESLQAMLDAQPELRDALNMTLANQLRIASDAAESIQPLLDQLSHLTRLSDMPRRVALLRQALAQIRRENNTPLWGALQVELGNALAQNPLDDRAANLEEAIAAYRAALEVRTRQAFPEQWATTHSNSRRYKHGTIIAKFS